MAYREWGVTLSTVMCVSLCATRGMATNTPRLPMASSPVADGQAAGTPRTRESGREIALLSRARESLGGAAALEEVTALALVRQDGTTERILFPDRLQTIIETPWGSATTSLDGTRWWSRIPALPSHLSGLKGQATATPAELVRSAQRKIMGSALKYLLRPLPGDRLRSKYAEHVTYCGVGGEAVEYTASDGYWFLLIFDPSSGLPRALVRRMGGTPEVNGTHLVEELRDYRPVGKIRMPHQIATSRLRLDKTEALAVWRFTIEVNPPLKPSDFAEPKSGLPIK